MGPLRIFINSEGGAITVDWVVLSASIIALALAGVSAARTGVLFGTTAISTKLVNTKVGEEP